MNPLELIAVITGIGSVLFSIQRHVYTYPIGLISVLLYVWLCFQGGLYGDMTVNIFFGFLSISGWIAWYQNADDSQHVSIGTLSAAQRIKFCLFLIGSIGIVWLILSYYTNSTVAFTDSVVTGFSVIGMILMNQRRIEHWICWLVVNMISIPLFWSKGLPLTSVQFFFLLCFSVWGFYAWKKKLQNNLS